MKRSVCPVTNVLDLIGDKWTLVIIRDFMFLGPREYGDLLTLSIGEQISTNVLANRLSKMVENGLLIKEPHPTDKKKYIYSLTPKGESLKPVLKYIADWGLENIKGTRTHQKLRI